MTFIGAILAKYPELAIFFGMGLGYFVGALKFRGFGLGPVTGSLIIGLVIGYYFNVPVSATAKAILFLLFLFSIGYSVGPKFFKAMKGDGLRWALLAIVITFTGLGAAYGVARVLHLDVGLAGGLVSGALTESPAIGTATEAINNLPLPEADRARLVGHVAVADALCYVFGAFGVIVFCSMVGPWLLRIDPEAEAKKVEEDLGIDTASPNVVSAWRPFEVRAYRIVGGSAAAGKSVAETEGLVAGARIFIERIRRNGAFIEFAPETTLRVGDVVALSGRRDVLTDVIGKARVDEQDDRELLDMPTAAYDVFVTNKTVIGKTLDDIAQSDLPLRSVFLRAIVRGDQNIPIAPRTRIERGDVVKLSGAESAVIRAAEVLGRTVAPSDVTDFVTLSLGIFTGALVGILVVIPFGSLRIALGTSVGTLLAGLLVGYVHSVRPWFGRIPDGAVALMISLGLAAFVTMIGLSAGPHFVEALRESGVALFFGGIVVTSLPLLVGLYFGVYVLKINPVLVLGGIAGALTMTAGLAAIQERSNSPVAVFGYSGTVAIGHILLTTWGTVIVHLVS
jgi:putative transport protein